MKVIIIEDEAPALRRLEKLLRELDPEIEIVATFDSISSTVSFLKNQPTIDLILSDIQLADGLSFEIFQQVKVETPIIFTTAFDEYAIRAFKVNSIDYLLKPIDIELLSVSLEKYRSLQKNTPTPDLQPILQQLLQNIHTPQPKPFRQRFLVSHRDTFMSISVDEVAYFYSENKLTYLVCHTGKKYVIPDTLEELESTLDPHVFFRANRQFLISQSAIQQIVTHFGGKLKLVIEPQIQEEIFVSREKAGILKEWLNR